MRPSIRQAAGSLIIFSCALIASACGCGSDSGLLSLANTPTANQSLSGIVWNDLHCGEVVFEDSIRLPNDTPIQGVLIELYDEQGTTLLASTQTDATGVYLFDHANVQGGVQAGVAYEVRIPLPQTILNDAIDFCPEDGNRQWLGFIWSVTMDQGLDDEIDSEAFQPIRSSSDFDDIANSDNLIPVPALEVGEARVGLDAGFTRFNRVRGR